MGLVAYIIAYYIAQTGKRLWRFKNAIETF